MEPRVLAVITARGGSKRIPRKNIRSFNGKPIIRYSIEAALGSGLFSEVMVSTDDAEIAAIAERCGARIPFSRSASTADDRATTAEVMLEVMGEYQKRGQEFPYFCCIYPTAPFVTGEKLRKAWEILRAGQADAVIPICPFDFPIWRAFKVTPGHTIDFHWPEHALTRSQDLPPAYHDSGQFYFLRTQAFLTERKMVLRRCAPLLLSPTEVQDIDTEDDWALAELKHQLMQRRLSS